MKIMNEYGIADKWGVLVADNADNNDTAYKILVDVLRPREPINARRSRYFSYIVNLTTKAFIYSKRYKSFITEAE